jgi:hypothetical protein
MLHVAQLEAHRVGRPDLDSRPNFQPARKTLNTIFGRNGGFNLTVDEPTGKEDTKIPDDELEELVANCVGNVLQWCADLARRHHLSTTPNSDPMEWLAHERTYTLNKMCNFDETPMKYDSDKKEGFTLMVKTIWNGEIFRPLLVVFNRKTQPEYEQTPGIVEVEGEEFFVAHNDSHHNNTILHYLWYVYGVVRAGIKPCPCKHHDCKQWCDTFDNFAGHFSDDVFDVMDAVGIEKIVIPLTLFQPCDNNVFHQLKNGEGGYYPRMKQMKSAHRATSTRLETEHKKPLAEFTREQMNMLALYNIRFALFFKKGGEI